MDIQRISGSGSVGPVDPNKRVNDSSNQNGQNAGSPVDEVNLSNTSRILNEVQKINGEDVIRTDKVQELSRLIQEGNFETEERLNKAADRLVDELIAETP